MSSLTIERTGLAAAVLNGKLYAIGGIGLSSVEIFDPSTESWSAGVALPSEVRYGTAITVDGMIYLIGGRNSSNQDISQVLCFDSSTNQWTAKANMPTARHGVKLVWFQNRIWAICGHPATQVVESYDIVTNSWQTESSLKISRFWSAAWVADERIYVGGGQYLNSIESYNSITKEWAITGNFPEDKYIADSIILNDKVYVIGGATAHGVYSNKVYAADLNASVAGVFDLYREDGNASAGVPTVQAEVADGSVTGRKMADGAITPSKIATNSITTSQLNEQILKYLKPEITTQPQAQTVYADTNVSFSVTAEGKYLTYQWKKDGVNLTGETNATLNITDANATQHDGNYSVVVSNDFGSVESDINEFVVENDINKVSGLVGWWKFDEMNGSVAYDSSGNGHDGNLTNSPTWVNGKMGGALSFDGVNDYVQVIGYKGIMDSNQRTICAWIKSDKNSTAIVSWGSGQGHKYWSLGISGEGLIRKNLWNGNIKGKQNIITNEWFHVTSVFPGQEFTFGQTILFVNGVKESVSSLTGGDLIVQTTSYRDLKIGSEAWGSNWNIYNGLIDDVRIYDRALSPSEVQALYNLGQ